MQGIYRRTLVLVATLSLAPIAPAQQERIITAEELQQLNPRSVQLIDQGTALDRRAALDGARLRGPAVDRESSSGVEFADSRAPASQPREYRIGPGEYLAVYSGEPAFGFECTAASGTCTQTPIRFYAQTTHGKNLNLALTHASTENFILVQPGDRFVGSAFVQLRDTDNPNAVTDIGFTIRVAVTADVDEITPANVLAFDQTNRFKDVKLIFRSPRNPTLVQLTPERFAAPQVLSFGVLEPQLRVELGQQRILGFGLETASVTVRAEGIENPPQALIAVSSEFGKLHNNTLQIHAASGVGSTFLRSRSTGKDTITVKLSRFAEDADTILYVTPWSWLIAVLMGIAAGIGIRLAMRTSQKPPGSGVAFNIAIGIIGGLVTAVLYALGVNILPLPLPGGFSEGLTFVLSALGGWVFPRWLEALGPASTSGPS